MKNAFLLTLAIALAACFAGVAVPGEEAASEEALYTPAVAERPEVSLIDEEGAGKLYQVGEWLVCVMEGTHREMGYQHGRLLAKQARFAIKEGYLKKMLWDRGYTPEYAHAQSVRMEKHFPAKYIEEMEGLVAGLKAAGVDDVGYEEVRLGVTSSELLHFDPELPPGCSNFAVWGRWTTDGRLLHGRNLDWAVNARAQESAAILIWRPTGGTPFMMVGWAGGIGSVSGMNAHGITLGEMTLPSKNATFDGLPLTLRMRMVMEEAATLEAAVAILRDYPQTSGWNYIVGDGRARDGRALETDAGGVDIYAPLDEKEGPETEHKALPDAVRRTNHPVSKARLVDLAKAYGKEYGIIAGDWEQLKPLLPLVRTIDTFQRYEYLGACIEGQEGKIDVREALQMLANGPVFNSDTLHACVFDPGRVTVYVANAGSDPPVTATRREFTKIDLAPWFD